MRIDPASYRDPSGFVFHVDGAVYRALDATAWNVVEDMHLSGVMGGLTASGLLAGTRLVDPSSEEQRRLTALCEGRTHFVAHEKVSVVSYPYEWSFTMLADAALTTLRLQERLLQAGLSLKDASAFNILFSGSHPVFIDIASVERPRRLDIWTAYGQFCRMFLNPLLAAHYKGLSFKQVFLADLEGIDNRAMLNLFGTWGSLRPALLMDVLLPGLLEGRAERDVQQVRSSLQKSGGDIAVQRINLERLVRKMEQLVRRRRASSAWTDYERNCTYTDEATADKKRWITRFLAAHRPARVLDLGCNLGAYSALAAESGARVIAADADEACVDHVHGMAKERGLDILPMVVNVANPSPGLGFLGAERQAWGERVVSECVLALALVHHLLVAARLPPAAIAEMLAGLTTQHLVVEYIEREDDMFQKLLALREDLYGGLTMESFIGAFSPRFDLVDRYALPGTRRHLLSFRKKS